VLGQLPPKVLVRCLGAHCDCVVGDAQLQQEELKALGAFGTEALVRGGHGVDSAVLA
jgi:hypothetical protein